MKSLSSPPGDAPGALFVVATPLGNLEDLSPRALAVLRSVATICAEDTRHTRILCAHWGIDTPLLALHEHNERARSESLLARLTGGESLALVSDAGTPLISDPGYRLVRGARAAHIPVYAVAGPSAVAAALSVAGIPCDRFAFEGFPPAHQAARRAFYAALAAEPRTLVFYESPHRLRASLEDLCATFGEARPAALLRELTKRFEDGRLGTLADLARAVQAHTVKGECVLVVQGAPAPADDGEAERVLRLLLKTLPVRQAVDLAVAITHAPRKQLYQQALAWKDSGS